MLEKHSVTIAGHKTSFTLEPEFWAELKRIATERDQSVASIVASLDKEKDGNLSSRLRVWVLNQLRPSTSKFHSL